MSLESTYQLTRRKPRTTESPDELLRQADDAYAAGDLEGTERLALRVLALDPESAGAMVLAGFVAAHQERNEDAIDRLQTATERDSSLWGPRTALAAILGKCGRSDEAIRYLQEALVLNPNDLDTLSQLGECYLRVGSVADAGAYFELAVNQSPDATEAQYQLGLALESVGRWKSALDAYRRVGAEDRIELLGLRPLDGPVIVPKDPVTADGWLWLAKAHDAAGEFEPAEGILRQLIHRFPDFTEAYAHLGLLLQQLGRFDDGATQLRSAISLQPKWARLHMLYVAGRRISEMDRPLLERVRQLLAERTLAPPEQAELHLTFGKALDDLKEYDEAMQQFDAGNALLKHLIEQVSGPFPQAAYESMISETMEAFEPGILKNRGVLSEARPIPILIVGMVRSGTTLVEQMLARHPMIGDGGELLYWHKRWRDYRMRPTDLNSVALNRWREEYLQTLTDACPGRPLVTDKQPGNFHSLGLILAAVPDAVVIHCRRHPLDTCLSIYGTPNLRGVPWRHDKGTLAFVYHQYQRLMEYWREVVPADRLLEIDYEELVLDPDGLTRKMIEFCGLEWDQAHESHKNSKAVIRTPSLWQARQPVYASSTGRWHNYKDRLGELTKLL